MDTPFETTGAVTSRAATASFLNSLATATGRVSVTTVGTSNKGDPLLLVGVSTTPPVFAQNRVPHSFFIVARQHGDEPAGQEAALAVIRDLAETTDAATVAYMAEHPIWVAPTWSHETVRTFPDGTDPNRDLIDLAHPESVAWAETIDTLRPHMVLNVHENGTISTPAVEVSGWNGPDALTAGIVTVSYAARDAMRDALTAAGITNGIYSDWVQANPTTLNSLAGFRPAANLVIETSFGSSIPLATRVEASRVAQNGAVGYVVQNHDTIQQAVIAEESAILEQSAYGRTWPAVSAAVEGYTLTAVQLAAVDHALDAHGIDYQTHTDGTAWVPLGQPLAMLALQTLDPSAAERLTTATRATPPAWTSGRWRAQDGVLVPLVQRP